MGGARTREEAPMWRSGCEQGVLPKTTKKWHGERGSPDETYDVKPQQKIIWELVFQATGKKKRRRGKKGQSGRDQSLSGGDLKKKA